MSDAVEALGQNVQQEAPDELVGASVIVQRGRIGAWLNG
jgi:hypothetical protein